MSECNSVCVFTLGQFALMIFNLVDHILSPPIHSAGSGKANDFHG